MSQLVYYSRVFGAGILFGSLMEATMHVSGFRTRGPLFRFPSFLFVG